MTEVGIITRDKSRQKRANNNKADLRQRTRVRIVTDLIYLTFVAPMTFVTSVTFITFITSMIFACHKWTK